MRENGRWTNRKARGYRHSARVKNPFQLRLNSYPVLLTRGRDGTVVFIPPLLELEELENILRLQDFAGWAIRFLSVLYPPAQGTQPQSRLRPIFGDSRPGRSFRPAQSPKWPRHDRTR